MEMKEEIKYPTVHDLQKFLEEKGELKLAYTLKEILERRNQKNELLVVDERDALEETLHKMTENTKAQLIEISKRANIDMNTLWIAFKSSLEELENKT